MTDAEIWAELDLERTKDITAIRRAYARRLKSIDPETDPAAFIALREARDHALRAAQLSDDEELPWQGERPGDDAIVQTIPIAASQDVRDVPRPVPMLDADDAAVERLRAMIFDPADRHGYEDIAAQTEAVVRDPAMLNIEHARQMEGLIANMILHGTPRSDAMMEPAIRHFKWDRVETELTRPPIVDWILRRRGDGYFEANLHLQSKLYARVLARLRQPPPETGGWLLAWRLGVRVEFLLAYLQQVHSTVVNGLGQATLDWWQQRIVAQHKAIPPLRWLREIWRRLVFHRGIATDHRDVNFALYYGVFFLPLIFVWFFLRRGHSWQERAVGFGWCAVILIGMSMPKPADDYRVPPQQFSEEAGAEPIRFKSFDEDLRFILGVVTDPVVTVDQLKDNNLKLYLDSGDRWRRAKQGGADFTQFSTDLVRSLNASLPAALHGHDAKLISDFAAFYATELRWTLMGGPQNCINFMRGKGGPPLPDEVVDYRKRLVARALLAGPPRPAPKVEESLVIPPAVFDAALTRSRLPRPIFLDALQGKGWPDVRCTAQIVLLEAAASHPSVETTRFLRGAFTKL